MNDKIVFVKDLMLIGIDVDQSFCFRYVTVRSVSLGGTGGGGGSEGGGGAGPLWWRVRLHRGDVDPG